MSCNKARIAAIGFVPALMVLLGAVGWIGSERAIHPAAKHYATTLAAYPDLHPSEIRFQSRTRVAIAATFFPGVRHAVIVLSHGYGDNQAQMLPYAEFLHGAGYSDADVDGGRIGALGVSLGGSTTLLAAADDRRIKAIVDDSGFSDAPAVIESSFEHFIGLPAFPFAPITTAIAGWRVGIDVNVTSGSSPEDGAIA